MLKNVLIVVDDIEKSIEFYRDLFGLQVILQNEGNVILSEGLVLQDTGLWGKTLDEISTPFNNRMELYFEEFDIDGLLAKYEAGKFTGFIFRKQFIYIKFLKIQFHPVIEWCRNFIQRLPP